MSEEGTSESAGTSATLACGAVLPAIALEQVLATGAEGDLSAFPGNNLMPGIALGETALMGVSQLLGQGFGWGINRLLGLAGLSIPFLGDILSIGIFAALHFIKFKGWTGAQWAHWYFTNILDRASDGRERQGVKQCATRREMPPEFRLTDPQRECLSGLVAASSELGSSFDVTACFADLLERFKPVEYRYPDDLPAITLEELLAHGRVRDGERVVFPTAEGQGLPEYAALLATRQEPDEDGNPPPLVLEIDSAYARGEGSPSGRDHVYARAYWNPEQTVGSATLVVLEYAHLRAGDWNPGRYLYESSFYHQGDGESAEVYVYVNTVNGAAWIAGSKTGGHDGGCWCPEVSEMLSNSSATPIPIEFDRTGEHPRPVIYIAHGSHAIAPTSGLRATPKFPFVTDWYPPMDPRYRVDPQLVLSTEPYVRDAFFTSKVRWGADSGSYPGKAHFEPPPSTYPCACAAGGGSSGGGAHA